MNADEHGPTGAAVGVFTAPAAAAFGADPVTWFAAVMAGVILPDVDQPGASIARMWGPVSGLIVGAVNPLAGGHRGLTHGRIDPARLAATWGVTAVVVVAVTAVARDTSPWAAAAWLWHTTVTHSAMPAAFVWAFIAGVALTAFDRTAGGRPCIPWPVNLATSAVIGYAAYTGGWHLTELAPGIAIGWAVHLAGDRVKAGSRTARALVAGSYLAVGLYAAAALYLRTTGATA